MSDDWDFYSLLVDNDPASIYLDLGLARNAPIESQPHLAYVRVHMRHPRPDGLSSNDEFEDLVAVEDSLSEPFARSRNTTYAGRNTSGGNRDFYFYTSDTAAFAQLANAAMALHPHYQFHVGNRLDPGWDVYRGFLYPKPADLQRMLNRRVTDTLTARGDDLSQPRPIDHVAYFPDAAAAASMSEYLRELEFIVDEPGIEGGEVGLGFNRSDRPDRIDDLVIAIEGRVRALGGTYDGWGCEVVK